MKKIIVRLNYLILFSLVLDGIFDNIELKTDNSNINHNTNINGNSSKNYYNDANKIKIIKEPEKKMTIITNDNPIIKNGFEENDNSNDNNTNIINNNENEIEILQESKDYNNGGKYNNRDKRGKGGYYNSKNNNYNNSNYNYNNNYNNSYNNNYNDQYSHKHKDYNYNNNYGGRNNYKSGYNDYNDYNDYGKNSYKKKNYYKGGYK
jgi:hypothetical protein